MKKQKKQKQIVTIRERILRNGDVKFYLDINQKGRKRVTETLDFIHLKNPKSNEERRQNQLTLDTIQIIRNKKEEELLKNKYCLTINLKSDTLLIDYVGYLAEQRKSSKGNYGNWDSMQKHLKKFCPENIEMGKMDKDWVQRFRLFLKDDCKLSSNSSHSYFNKFIATCNDAVKDKIILESPCHGVGRLPAITPCRSFLTEEELNNICKEDCRYEVLKRAFLFSVLTGLRWSDLVELRWGNIDHDYSKVTIRGHQEKTKEQFGIPLQPDAIKLMGDRGENSQKVFVGLKYGSYQNVALTQLCLKANITKKITFHCARHTFAYLLLKNDVNIYTISKLLGHSKVKTTELYLHLLDKEKQMAVEKLPTISLKLAS